MIQNASPELPLRCVSMDVEEYFHIEAAYTTIGPSRWKDWPSRIQASMDLLLEMFSRQNRKGTFFILGDVARSHPRLAAQVAAAGHEIASHGTMHDRLHRLNPQTFREDLLTSKKLLEDQTGQRVIGYRAPTFSVVPQTAWAIDVLLDAGFEYDASIFPVRHPSYGVPDAPDEPFMVQGPSGRSLLELPPLTWKLGKKKLAVAGGGYFRLLPLELMRRGLRQAAKDHRPAILYFHPWEFDPGLPRMPLPLLNKVRTYTGLKSAARKLEHILAQPARWVRLCDEIPRFKAAALQANPYKL